MESSQSCVCVELVTNLISESTRKCRHVYVEM